MPATARAEVEEGLVGHPAMRGGDVVIGIRYRYGRGRCGSAFAVGPDGCCGLQRVGRRTPGGRGVGGVVLPLHRADVSTPQL